MYIKYVKINSKYFLLADVLILGGSSTIWINTFCPGRTVSSGGLS
jgi:hypothetical protein